MNIKTNGVELHYTVEGNGPWVVLSHSLACNLSMWDEQARALAARYRVLRYDLRGHGASEAPAGAYTLEMLADDAHGLLQALGIASCHWVGLSIGGMIGQIFALKFPGLFDSLVLADTTSRYPPDAKPLWDARSKAAHAKGMEPVVEPTLARWFTEPFRKARPDMMARASVMIRSTSVNGYAGCCAAIPQLNTTGRLNAITCPALVMVGENDTGTPVEASRQIHAALPGSELVILPSAAHLSNLEQPEAFNHALLGFLDRQRSGTKIP